MIIQLNDKEKRRMAIDETAIEILGNFIPECGVSILYTGTINMCYESYEKGKY